MRMTIHLNEQEKQALLVMSKLDVRLPRDQVRFILQKEMKMRGLLPQEGANKGARFDQS